MHEKSDQKTLRDYIAHGNIEKIQELLSIGIEPSVSDLDIAFYIFETSKGKNTSLNLILQWAIDNNKLLPIEDVITFYCPFYIACKKGFIDTARLILKWAENNGKKEQLFLDASDVAMGACASKSAESIKFLIDEAGIDITNISMSELVYIACKNGNFEAFRTLIEKGVYIDDLRQLFTVASTYGEHEIVKFMLEHKWENDRFINILDNKDAINFAYENGNSKVLRIFLQYDGVAEILDEIVREETLSSLLLSGNLKKHTIAFALNEKARRLLDRGEHFYAPVLAHRELSEFISIFKKYCCSLSDMDIEQSFVISMHTGGGHWGAGVVRYNAGKLQLFLFESLAKQKDEYVKWLLGSNILPEGVEIYINSDKLQGADSVNCGIFSLDFVFHVMNQRRVLAENEEHGTNFFDYLDKHKKASETLRLDDGRDVQVSRAAMPLNMIRSMQSFSRIDERIVAEWNSNSKEPYLPVNKEGDYANARKHTAKCQADGAINDVNRRIQHKRERLKKHCKKAIAPLSQRLIKESIIESTLEGYRQMVDRSIAKESFPSRAVASSSTPICSSSMVTHIEARRQHQRSRSI